MKTIAPAWRTISIFILTLAVVIFSAAAPGKTQAWFVDSGVWVEARYGIGVIDYTVYIDGVDIGKKKGGQEVSLMVPIIGAGKINDAPAPVPAVISDGAARGAHDEFDEAVTLIRTKIVNHGGSPVGIRVDVDGSQLTGSGILCMPLPYGAAVDTGDYTITPSGGAVKTYKEYIKGELGRADSTPIAPWNSYQELVADVTAYWAAPDGAGKLNRVVEYAGKLPFVERESVSQGAIGFDINILSWAEYDQMEYSKDGKAIENLPNQAIFSKQGRLVLTITCTL